MFSLEKRASIQICWDSSKEIGLFNSKYLVIINDFFNYHLFLTKYYEGALKSQIDRKGMRGVLAGVSTPAHMSHGCIRLLANRSLYSDALKQVER